MEQIIRSPLPKHDCGPYLPQVSHYVKGTVANCTHCGSWYCVVSLEFGFGEDDVWRPVRWYHFRKKKLIRGY